ncbi:carcinoembryonic antigen-related cell adhesion molecule 3-like isoform X2 [Pelobates cultripes]|uniref:Carcinoembryonic antigen-related cell adhesion molecule 3-like isoform X2 n=1 Tax=Pelobates cultripes TaxID=61616 RepID=A0AAD1WQ02_PELCU|nr:carcinoembryonic antigen-related cell adhesion molecule 3-like isoform X2 [Pelobates cultripes]
MRKSIKCYIHLLFCIVAGTFGENLTVHKASVAVSVGQSILLQTSFTLSHETLDYEFQWETGDYVIAKYTAYNSSFTPQGIPTWTNGRTKIYPKYKERVEIYPLNGSLLLKNVKLNDTRIYIFCVLNVEKNIRLWVHENSKTLGEMKLRGWNDTIFIFRILLCFFFVTSLILITRCLDGSRPLLSANHQHS